MFGSRLCLAICLSATSAVVGCSPQSGVLYATVSGRVTLDGQPVEGARVRFMPLADGDSREAGHSSQGVTDAAGVYTLKTIADSPAQGAAVGKHRVAITTLVLEDNGNSSDAGRSVVSEERIPRRYADRRTTPLTFEVPPGGSDAADFALTSD